MEYFSEKELELMGKIDKMYGDIDYDTLCLPMDLMDEETLKQVNENFKKRYEEVYALERELEELRNKKKNCVTLKVIIKQSR